MVVHTNHPSTLEHGLADGCPRCGEIAKHPVRWLDSENLAACWQRMLLVEYGHPRHVAGYAHYRSETEGDACRVLLGHAEFLLTLGINPRRVLPGTTYGAS